MGSCTLNAGLLAYHIRHIFSHQLHRVQGQSMLSNCWPIKQRREGSGLFAYRNVTTTLTTTSSSSVILMGSNSSGVLSVRLTGSEVSTPGLTIDCPSKFVLSSVRRVRSSVLRKASVDMRLGFMVRTRSEWHAGYRSLTSSGLQPTHQVTPLTASSSPTSLLSDFEEPTSSKRSSCCHFRSARQMLVCRGTNLISHV